MEFAIADLRLNRNSIGNCKLKIANDRRVSLTGKAPVPKTGKARKCHGSSNLSPSVWDLRFAIADLRLNGRQNRKLQIENRKCMEGWQSGLSRRGANADHGETCDRGSNPLPS